MNMSTAEITFLPCSSPILFVILFQSKSPSAMLLLLLSNILLLAFIVLLYNSAKVKKQ
jgi:hypothetical protein